MARKRKIATRKTAPAPRPVREHWPARNVEMWPIDRPKDNPRNVRTHSEAQLAQLEGLIRKFGQTRPILIDGDAPEEFILAGHGTRAGMRRAGCTEIAVVVARGWTEAEKREYMLADNQSALNAGWADELGIELADISKLSGVDMKLIGFSDAQLKRQLAPSGSTPAPSARATREPTAEVGDVWQLGPHRVIVEDLESLDDISRLLERDAAVVLVIDVADADAVIGRWQVVSGKNAVLTGENRDFAAVGGERREERRAAAAQTT